MPLFFFFVRTFVCAAVYVRSEEGRKEGSPVYSSPLLSRRRLFFPSSSSLARSVLVPKRGFLVGRQKTPPPPSFLPRSISNLMTHCQSHFSEERGSKGEKAKPELLEISICLQTNTRGGMAKYIWDKGEKMHYSLCSYRRA